MSEDFSNLGHWLKTKLAERELSVEKLSVLSGISRAGVYFYMNDTYRPTESTMKKICDALGVPFEEGLRQYTVRKTGRPRGGRDLYAIRVRREP